MMRFIMVFFLAAVMVLEPVATRAQVRQPGAQRQRQELERRVQQGFHRLVQTQLGLAKEDLAALQGVMQVFRGDRQAVNQAQGALRYRLRDPGLGEISDEGAMEILGEMIRLQEAELDLYMREQTELLTVLSPKQLVRFYRVRDDWGRQIQQVRQRRGPGGPGGVGGRTGGVSGRTGGVGTPGGGS